ncbi:DUF4336 domain-containing protein [Chachezhania sediminis]|uniref:DUF4336 domain-containing protein n=1 Tax=Chachezhania sediminis TaxID=2599291 RepID=UPI00131CCFB2|nr:DUF4336 domain-containing protein [Chachezhania sediminis]
MKVYDPLDRLKPVADDIWLIDGPTIRFYGLPFPTRSTVIRLASGEVWVHSPIRLTHDLANAVRALGPVRHLIAPNEIHYAYVGDWQVAFDQATTWAAPGVVERAASRGMTLHVDDILDNSAAPSWSGEIEHLLVEGSAVHREVVFFHRASRSLILTDLIENFEPSRVPFWFRPLARLAGIADPHGSMPRDMRATFGSHRDQLRSAIDQMLAWEPERVILAHGRWYATDGTAELRRAFDFLY